MAFFIIGNATGQLTRAQPARATDRQAVRELIEAALQKSFQEKDHAAQVNHYQRIIDQVIKLCPDNLDVTQATKKAMSKATDVKDDREAARLLIDALREAQATLAFKPYIEAPLPEGFPEPTQVGEIRIKQYPKYRLARTQMAGVGNGAF